MSAHQGERVAPPDDDALPPVIDLELTGNCSERPPADDVAAFVRMVEQEWGRDVLFYVRPGWDELYPIRAGLDRRLWEISFLRRPDDERWYVWQLHAFANVEGISGGVDLDVMRAGRPSISRAVRPAFARLVAGASSLRATRRVE